MDIYDVCMSMMHFFASLLHGMVGALKSLMTLGVHHEWQVRHTSSRIGIVLPQTDHLTQISASLMRQAAATRQRLLTDGTVVRGPI